MPDHRSINRNIRLVIAAACGVTLLGGAAVFADLRDDLTSRDISETERSRHAGVSGGFYEDRHTADDWFYDYYENPADRSDRAFSDRAVRRYPDETSYSERDRVSDASHPINSRRDFQRRSARENVYRRYYDDPWFYESRNQAYGMPMTSSWNDTFRSPNRDEEFVRGTVVATKHVRNRDIGGQNTVALVGLNDGRRVIADLGPTQGTLHFALTQGVSIEIGGQRENIGPYSVLMARDIKSGVNRIKLEREAWVEEVDYRLISGRIEQFADIRLRQNAELHRTTALRTDDGRLTIVDIGPSQAQNVSANAAPGDRLTASGPVVQVGNYPVLLADRIAINSSTPMWVVRSQAEYVEPSRRPFEASQEESATNPTCVGGGCEAGTVDRATPRNPLGNDGP